MAPIETVADLHVHSYLSRATSRQCDLLHLAIWARRKGISLLGTGDFTHPEWLDRIRDELVPEEDSGLYRLRPDLAARAEQETPGACHGPVRFVLQVEISSIYKRDGKVRKVHNLVYFPDLEGVARFREALGAIGNLGADGRPILGLDSRDLLEITLSSHPRGKLIPAHVWTPWFSVFGSKSGFDSLEACYGDLTPHLFALETGLSSDPPMNWRVSRLDGLTLVSNSDAHSPAKLGREANLLRCALTYDDVFDAIAAGTPDVFGGTVEFYPEEGKYHLDGCRRCGQRLTPSETRAAAGRCPRCGRKVTVGVMHRVEELADRPEGARPDGAADFESLVPLAEVLGECMGQGSATKRVSRAYEQLLGELGPEMDILRRIPVEDVARIGGPLLGEALTRLRAGRVHLEAGYDGVFGVVRVFAPGERDRLLGQKELFALGAPGKASAPRKATPGESLESEGLGVFRSGPHSAATVSQPDLFGGSEATAPRGAAEAHGAGAPHADPLLASLTAQQQAVVRSPARVQLVVAGPGAGKTRTLTCRIAYLLTRRGVDPGRTLAVTFTHRAAGELRERLGALLAPGAVEALQITTFHGLGLSILRRHAARVGLPEGFPVLDPHAAAEALALERGVAVTPTLVQQVHALRSTRAPNEQDVAQHALRTEYRHALERQGAVDFADLIERTVALLAEQPEVAAAERARLHLIALDEYQDIDPAQRDLLRLLWGPETWLTAIGDPDQAIYGFRGADVGLFARFSEDFPGTERFELTTCFRCSPPIVTGAAAVVASSPDFGRVRMAPLVSPPPAVPSGTALPSSGAQASSPVRVHRFATPSAEASAVVAELEGLLGAVHSLSSARADEIERPLGFGDVAVLARTHERLEPVAAALAEASFPVDRVRPGAEEDPAARALLSLFRGVLGRARAADVLPVLSWLRRGQARASARPECLDLRGAPEKRGAGPAAPLGRLALAEWIAERLEAFPLRGRAAAQGAQLVGWLQGLGDEVSGIPASSLLAQCAGVLGIAWPPGEADSVPSLVRLGRLAEQIPESAAMWLDRIETDKDEGILPRAERVSLLTLHAAKGLEFEAVFLVGCEEGTLPHVRGDLGVPLPPERLHEECRLLYVGMTRARHYLWLGAARSLRRHGLTVTPPLCRFLRGQEPEITVVEHATHRRARQMDLL